MERVAACSHNHKNHSNNNKSNKSNKHQHQKLNNSKLGNQKDRKSQGETIKTKVIKL